ncbi:MAG: hypothetical protein V4628_08680 [Pseudomonadota bacterium]
MNFSFSAARNSIPLLAVLISCLFSFYSIIANPVLNNDAYGYLRAAEIFNAEGIRPVLDHYGWYGYSILIALADRVLPGDLVASAHILNTLSYALLVFTFVKICAEYRPTRRVEFFAALTILSFPLLNEMRYFLIRDFAFWAFALLGFLLLLRYERDRKLLTALYSGLALLAAIVFRLEGLLLAVIVPFGLLVSSGSRTANFRLAGKLLLVLGLAFIVIFVLALLANVNLLNLIQYAYRFYLPLLFNLNELISSAALNLNQTLFTAENFPGNDNTGHGLVVLTFAYCYVVVANLIGALGMPFSVLLIYAYVRGYLVVPANLRWALGSYLTASVLALLCFVFIMHFLTQRYATLLCLLLLTLVPLALDNIYQHANTNETRRKFRNFFGFLCACLLIDSLLSFGYSKQYVEDASGWAVTELPVAATLRTNNFAVAYASKRIADFDKVPLGVQETLQLSHSADYLMLDIKRDDLEVKKHLDANSELQLIQSFANKRGDEVRVYLQR